MHRILVPVDFYKTSFSAFNYAANLAELFPDSEVTLIHIIHGSFNTSDVITFDPMIGRADAAMARLTYFSGQYAKDLGITLPTVNVQKVVRYGIPGFAITEYAKQHNIDLIVMGTRDKHSLFDRLLGSSSAIAVRTATCPVLLIHENVPFKKTEKIVFAVDSKSDIDSALISYKEINTTLRAKTDFIHVNLKKKDHFEKQKTDIIEELVNEDGPNFSFEIKSIEGKELKTALMDYCLFEKADMLAMVHRKEGLFHSLFRSNQSVQLAQEFHLPVLVFHEKK